MIRRLIRWLKGGSNIGRLNIIEIQTLLDRAQLAIKAKDEKALTEVNAELAKYLGIILTPGQDGTWIIEDILFDGRHIW